MGKNDTFLAKHPSYKQSMEAMITLERAQMSKEMDDFIGSNKVINFPNMRVKKWDLFVDWLIKSQPRDVKDPRLQAMKRQWAKLLRQNGNKHTMQEVSEHNSKVWSALIAPFVLGYSQDTRDCLRLFFQVAKNYPGLC